MAQLPIYLKLKFPDKHLYHLRGTVISPILAYFIFLKLVAGDLLSLFHDPLMDIELQFVTHCQRHFPAFEIIIGDGGICRHVRRPSGIGCYLQIMVKQIPLHTYSSVFLNSLR